MIRLWREVAAALVAGLFAAGSATACDGTAKGPTTGARTDEGTGGAAKADEGTGGAAEPAAPAAAAPAIPGAKVLMVIASDKFRDEELFDTRAVLESAGAKVTVASSKLDPAKGMMGGEAKPDALLTATKAEEFDAVVFVGGVGAKEYFESEPALALARAAAAGGKVLAAICIAPSILANAGLLKGKKATAYASEEENLAAKGATFGPGPVAEDGDVVTANGPAAAKEFGAAIARALAAKRR